MIFRIDLKIFIFLILFFLTKQIEIYALIMIFCIIHELGHLIAGILLGLKLKKIEIMPFGFAISFLLKIDDYNKKILKANLLEVKKIIIAFAGPLTNILLVLFFSFYDIPIIEKEKSIYSNLIIALFNLLPIYPLDGGRILKGFIHIFFGKIKSQNIINEVSNILLIIITFISSISIYYFKNIAIFLIVIFLWVLVIRENQKHIKMTKLLQQ